MNRAAFVDEEVSSFGLGFVLGQLGPAQKLVRFFFPGSQPLEEARPGCLELDQHLIGDFARQGLIGLRRFDLGVQFFPANDPVFVNERLAQDIVGRIPQILGGKSRRVNLTIAGV